MQSDRKITPLIGNLISVEHEQQPPHYREKRAMMRSINSNKIRYSFCVKALFHRAKMEEMLLIDLSNKFSVCPVKPCV
jgi:hypothetical protein